MSTPDNLNDDPQDSTMDAGALPTESGGMEHGIERMRKDAGKTLREQRRRSKSQAQKLIEEHETFRSERDGGTARRPIIPMGEIDPPDSVDPVDRHGKGPHQSLPDFLAAYLGQEQLPPAEDEALRRVWEAPLPARLEALEALPLRDALRCVRMFADKRANVRVRHEIIRQERMLYQARRFPDPDGYDDMPDAEPLCGALQRCLREAAILDSREFRGWEPVLPRRIYEATAARLLREGIVAPYVVGRAVQEWNGDQAVALEAFDEAKRGARDDAEAQERYSRWMETAIGLYEDARLCRIAVDWARLNPAVRKRMKKARKMGWTLGNIGRFIDAPHQENDVAVERLRKRMSRIRKGYEQDPVGAEEVPSDAAIAERDEALADLAKRLKELEPRQSVAAKAAELALLETWDTGRSFLDWINDAPFELIERTYAEWKEGSHKGATLMRARLRHVFGEESATTANVRILLKLGPSDSRRIFQMGTDDALRGARADIATYLTILEQLRPTGLDYSAVVAMSEPKTLAAHAWLIRSKQQDSSLSGFPPDAAGGGNAKQQQLWCAERAFSRPAGWTPSQVGQLVFGRLEAGTDPTLHDATHWLQEFSCPAELPEGPSRSPQTELRLLNTMRRVPQKHWDKISAKREKYAEAFSSDGTLIVYEALLGLYRNDEVRMEDVREAAARRIAEYEQDRRLKAQLRSPATLRQEVEAALAAMERPEHTQDERSAPALLQELRTIGQRFEEYTRSARQWLQTHGQSPHALLTQAWRGRAEALQHGIADNPRTIVAWLKTEGLRAAVADMEKRNALPGNFTREDLVTYNDWCMELVQHYDPQTIIRFLLRIKQHLQMECRFPSELRTLQNGREGEVLRKDSPEGATIGPATGCCMTLTGESAACIQAGYERPDCGFFALRENKGQLIAQSFLWINEAESGAPDTMVLDNIECCRGKDMTRIISSYQEFFRGYLLDRKRADPSFAVRKVHLGLGYTKVSVAGLQPVTAVMKPYAGYSDAGCQVLLLEIPQEEFERAAAGEQTETGEPQ